MSEKLYKCPECKAVDTGDNWDNATKNFCEDDEIFLISSSETDGEFGVFHICPNCENQIDNEKIERIEEVEDKHERCKVCNSDSEFVKLDDEISATICDKILVVSQYSTLYMESDVVEIEVNYCPMCGRKL